MAKDILVSWLNDAYAMEQAQVEMQERFIKDFADEPDIRQKLEEHLEETKQQAEDLKACLGGMNESVSGFKSAMGNLVGMFQGMSTGMYKDEKIKNMIMLHAGEHFEHASYIALEAAAKSEGREEVAQLAGRIAEEERATAEWAEERLPALVESYLSDRASEHEADVDEDEVEDEDNTER
jgi:ferritin-like metal-binding protein YciE